MFLISARRHFPVFAPDSDRISFDVGFDEAARMIQKNQARLISGGRALRLTVTTGETAKMRTRTSRGGLRGACGCGQVYTESEHNGPNRGKVTGHKQIYPEDLRLFYSAYHSVLSKEA
jgi:hypothetical protein